MNLVLRLAWRNLWRQPRRTWLTTGAMVFSNVLLVFMISLQFGMYRLMIENSLQAFTGHMQVQAPGYKDDQKMRQTVPDVTGLAEKPLAFGRVGNRRVFVGHAVPSQRYADDGPSLRIHDAADFGKRATIVIDVLEHVLTQDDVEGLVGER